MRLATKLLQEWRQGLGLTQLGAAKRLGISQPSYRQWERSSVPDTARAVLLEQVTLGRVPVKAWAIELDEPVAPIDAAEPAGAA